MCGIYALIDPAVPPATLCALHERMARRLAHRGPDAEGVLALPRGDADLTQLRRRGKTESRAKLLAPPAVFADAAGFLGHQRLAIIDRGERAHQPLVDSDRRVALTLNGEIYNYVELRAELHAAGREFVTTSDTEVALAAYLEWGEECFGHFNGDFAIVIYDGRRRTLLGARDRFGVKPLYVARRSRRLALASELKALVELDWLTPTLNRDVAYRYLAADFPTEQTLGQSFLSDVRVVPAAHRFSYELDSGAWRCAPYWNLADEVAAVDPPRANRDAVALFDDLLADAVRLRLRSDVPVGAFLSGGLDSPSVAWHAQRAGADLPTFSAVYPGLPADESAAIRLLADAWGLRNVASPVDFDDLAAQLDTLAYLQDEPFSTLNVYSQFQNLRAAANRGVNVVLDGGGADEYLAGYDDYRLLAAADAYRAGLTESDDPLVARLLRLSNEQLAAEAASRERETRTVAYLADGPWRGEVDRPLDNAYKGEFGGSLLKHALLRSMTAAWMNKSVAWDNRYLDRSSMWVGVEARAPFQDHRLVAYSLSLPPHWLMRRGFGKLPLRQAMCGRLPSAIRAQRRKIGFEFPFCALLRQSAPLREYFFELAAADDLADIELIDADAVRCELRRIVSGESHNYNVWRAFNLQLWLRRFTRAARPAPVLTGATP